MTRIWYTCTCILFIWTRTTTIILYLQKRFYSMHDWAKGRDFIWSGQSYVFKKIWYHNTFKLCSIRKITFKNNNTLKISLNCLLVDLLNHKKCPILWVTSLTWATLTITIKSALSSHIQYIWTMKLNRSWIKTFSNFSLEHWTSFVTWWILLFERGICPHHNYVIRVHLLNILMLRRRFSKNHYIH